MIKFAWFFVFIAMIPQMSFARKMNDFTLKSIEGKTFNLYQLKEQYKAIVLIAHSCECPVIRQSYPSVNKLVDEFKGKKVFFAYLNAASKDDIKTIKEETSSFSAKIPVLKDEDQSVTKDFGFKISSETAIIDTKTMERVYMGALDDQMNFDIKKKAPKFRFVFDALNSLLKGERIRIRRTKPYGCFITFKKKD